MTDQASAPRLDVRYWNLEQAFPRRGANAVWPYEDRLSSKALIWDVEQPSVTLADVQPAADLSRLGLIEPRQHMMRLPHDGDAASAWWETEAGRQLIDLCLEAKHIRLTPAIWTKEASGIADSLRKRGVDVMSEVKASHGRIFHWNTRVGMRDLFLADDALADVRVPSIICHDGRQLRLTIDRLDESALMVKSNFALGGFGSCLVEKASQVELSTLEDLNRSFLDSEAAKKGVDWAWRDEPFVVETVVGNPRTNRSVTVDARCREHGVVELVGLSEQLLARETHYRGIATPSAPPIVTARPRMETAVESVGAQLAARGYRGHFNLDFVVTDEGTCHLVDLNVRRSAPLDLHMVLRRISAQFPDLTCYRHVEDLPVMSATEDELRRAIDARGRGFGPSGGLVVVRGPSRDGDGPPRAAVLGVADDPGRLEWLFEDPGFE